MNFSPKDLEKELGKTDEKVNLEIEEIIKRERGNELVSLNIG